MVEPTVINCWLFSFMLVDNKESLTCSTNRQQRLNRGLTVRCSKSCSDKIQIGQAAAPTICQPVANPTTPNSNLFQRFSPTANGRRTNYSTWVEVSRN